jgi:hypothetical protein
MSGMRMVDDAAAAGIAWVFGGGFLDAVPEAC